MELGKKTRFGRRSTVVRPLSDKHAPLLERFWRRAGRTDDARACWEWRGYREQDEYGRITKDRKILLAHRLSWEIHNGPIPVGMAVCHRCDNPPCVNPAHLFLGSNQDNLHDRDAKGRTPRAPGIRNGMAKLTDAIVVAMREDRGRGLTYDQLAAKYGINRSACCAICLRQKWKHVA